MQINRNTHGQIYEEVPEYLFFHAPYRFARISIYHDLQKCMSTKQINEKRKSTINIDCDGHIISTGKKGRLYIHLFTLLVTMLYRNNKHSKRERENSFLAPTGREDGNWEIRTFEITQHLLLIVDYLAFPLSKRNKTSNILNTEFSLKTASSSYITVTTRFLP